jgi:hypothetical protein
MAAPILCLFIGAARIQAMLVPAVGDAVLLLDEAFAGMQLDGSLNEVGHDGIGLAAALGRLEDSSARGARIRAVLSDRWLSSACVPWDASQYQARTARAGAQAYVQAAGHDCSAGDTLRFDDAPWHAARLAIGYPASLLGALHAWAQRTGGSLESVLSLAAAVSMARRQSAPGSGAPVSAVIEPITGGPDTESVFHAVLIKWAAAGMRLEEVCARPLVGVLSDPAEAVVPVVRRLSWSSAPEVPQAQPAIEVIDFSRPVQAGHLSGLLSWWAVDLAARRRLRVHPLDAVARYPAWTGVQAFAVAALASACLVAGLRLASDHAALRTAREAALPVAGRTFAPAQSREELRKVTAINTAISELNVPLPSLMRALQPPKDIRIALLGLELGSAGADTSRPALKIGAEAPTSQDMTRYVAYLGERKPFTKAYLTRHEVTDAGSGPSSFRFVVEVEWKE